jgi:plasmid stability protein
MSVNVSIKNAPDELVRRLRERATRSHRSLQGELLAILEQAVQAEQRLTPAELLAAVNERGLTTGAEAARLIRADRDAR